MQSNSGVTSPGPIAGRALAAGQGVDSITTIEMEGTLPGVPVDVCTMTVDIEVAEKERRRT